MTDTAGTSPFGGVTGPGGDAATSHRAALVKEGTTMALYVAICLLAALAVVSRSEVEHQGTVMKIVWGTTIGLALAHLIAFRVAARLAAGGRLEREDGEAAIVQVAGAAVVALVATLPVLVFDGDHELDATRLVLAAVLATAGFLIPRSSGASTLRCVASGATTLAIALAVAALKNLLAGH